jgi:hypothetical protein
MKGSEIVQVQDTIRRVLMIDFAAAWLIDDEPFVMRPALEDIGPIRFSQSLREPWIG